MASPTLARFDHDWQRIRHHRPSLAQARQWQVVNIPFFDLDVVIAATDPRRAESASDADTCARRLVTLAHDDDLAAHVVLRRMLPGLIAIHHRRARFGPGDHIAELLAGGWVAIRTFNPRRRPASIIAALIHDANHQAFRVGRRRRNREFPTAEPPDRATADEPHGLVELAAIAAHAHLDERHRRVLTALVNTEIQRPASVLGVTDRSVRNYRAELVRAFRAAA